MKKILILTTCLLATNDLSAKWGVHAKNDSQLNLVYIVSLIGILILRFLYRLITRQEQGDFNFQSLLGPIGLAFLITLIFWIIR